jgi:hypothetical protein
VFTQRSIIIALFGLATIATGIFRATWLLAPAMLVAGAAWVSFLSLFNAQLLNRGPDWVRARVLAVSLLVSQGAIAGGSAVWGAVAGRARISQALLWAGVGALVSAASALFLEVSDVSPDLTPWQPAQRAHFTRCPNRPVDLPKVNRLDRRRRNWDAKPGHPSGRRMLCGWHCGSRLTASGMRTHFTDCARRPWVRGPVGQLSSPRKSAPGGPISDPCGF